MRLEIEVTMCHRRRALNGSLSELGGYHFCLAELSLDTCAGGYAGKLSTAERTSGRYLERTIVLRYLPLL
jgi:hypothetical protein